VRVNRSSLLLIFVLAWTVIASDWVSCLGTCNGFGSNYLVRPQGDESYWRAEIYYFMDFDNCNNVNSVCGNSYTSPTFNQTTGNGTAKYWMNSANKLYLTGSYEQAASSYDKAVNLDPSLTQGWLNMGNTLYLLSRYQESLDAYNATLKLDPLNANATMGIEKVLLALNKTGGSNVSTGMSR
jgi:tetratricopeptide (TPR) repeat protein